MDKTTETQGLVSARRLFGYDHDVAGCCQCCDHSTCLLADTPIKYFSLANTSRPIVVLVNGEEYVTDRAVMVRRDALDLSEIHALTDSDRLLEIALSVPDELTPPEGVALPPATTARCFDAALTVHAGAGGVLDPQVLAGRDGKPVGWIQPDKKGLSAEDVEKVRAAAAASGVSISTATAALESVGAVTLLVNDHEPRRDGREA